MRIRVKVCGLTRAEDAQAAVAAGVDAIGLVFYPPSPRAVTPQQAQQVVANLPPFVTVTGLFVDATRESIAHVLKVVRIDLLQFHGEEPPTSCLGYGKPWIKAIRMAPEVDLLALHAQYQGAAAVLLDAYQPGIPGGTGSRFAWERIPQELRNQIILAGGLTPDTVEQAVRQIRPYAVDVSGGVEQRKGIKDAAKIAAFMRGVRRGEQPA
ncbi:N-(5'-phosphoribosyl)anthranilate isomerase [Achromatium sp. WMS2]|nr:N-(5'-phosphoribosyl)anthranilate isomerase [Achromatium sp. WMS2]